MKRILCLLVLSLLHASVVLSGTGSGESGIFSYMPYSLPDSIYVNAPISPAFSIFVDPQPTSFAVAAPFSPRFNLVTNQVSRDYSNLFALGGGSVDLVSSWYHLGDDALPPCTVSSSQSVGSQATIEFLLTGEDLEVHRQYGTDLLFYCRNVENGAETSLSLNGYQLSPLPAVAGCDSVTYKFPVTDFLINGKNELVISLTNDLDCMVGNFRLATSDGGVGPIAVQVQPGRGEVNFNVAMDDQPFDGVRVDVQFNGQVIRSGQPVGGGLAYKGLIDGLYDFQVRSGGDQGEILEEGSFTIDLSNQLPLVDSALATPAQVSNSGTDEVTFAISASDSDGSIESVTIDLRQIGGAMEYPLVEVGGDLFEATYLVPDSTAAANYRLPVSVRDDLGAYSQSEVNLAVTPVGGWDTETLQACGFMVQATHIEQSGGSSYSASGDIQLTHSSGLPLYLVGTGSLLIQTAAPQLIQASGEWTLKVDLGDLGVYDVYHGEFDIDEQGNLTVANAANYVLDEIAGFPRNEKGSVDFNLIFGANPGIQVTADLVFDPVDGILGNGEPTANIEASLLADGSVLGVLSSTSGALQWDFGAGTAAIDSLLLVNQTLTVTNASFSFLNGTFDQGSSGTLVIPHLEIGPEGIHSDGVAIDTFDFSYGGFLFHVDEATLTNSSFMVKTARAVFPLQPEPMEIAVEDIAISQGTLTLQGGELRIPPLKIGKYDLAGVYGHFSKDDDHLYIAAEGALAIPAFATVGISFQLDSQCEYLLKEFCMAAKFSGHGIPIGNTGFLLTDIGGCIADQNCSNNWIITFTAGVASADYVDPPGISLISSDAEMHISPSPFQLGASGTVLLVGNYLGGAGFDIYDDRFEGYGNISLPPGLPFLVAQTNLLVRWSPEFYFLGTAEGVFQVPVGELPEIVRGLISGENLDVGAFSARIDPEQVNGVFAVLDPENPIAEVSASYQWASKEFSFSVDVDWGWPWLHLDAETGTQYGIIRREHFFVQDKRMLRSPVVYRGPDASHLLIQAKASSTTLDSVTTVAVPAGSPPLVAILNEQPAGSGTHLTLELLTPTNVVVDSAYCSVTAGYQYVRGPDAVCYRVADPDSGSWVMTVGDIQEGETYQLDAFFRNQTPTFQWLDPLGSQNLSTAEQVSIAWASDDPDGDATFTTLKAIPDQPHPADPIADTGPWLIAEDMPDSVTSFAWLPATMQTGNYKLVAECRDRFGRTVVDTSEVVISLTNLDHPRQPTGLRASVGPERIRVMWDRQGREDLRGYRLFYQPEGASQPDTFDVGLTNQYLLESLANGQPYEVWVEGYDVMDLVGPVSEPLVATPQPMGDVDPPDVPSALEVTSFDAETNVVTIAWQAVADAVAYHLHYDINLVGFFTGTGAAEGDSPVLQSRTTGLTLTGLQQGRRYYLAVSALDAVGNESATSLPVSILVSRFDDIDADGLPDDWEQANLGGMEFGPDDDPDGDFLTNQVELEQTLTHPGLADTDGDALVDGVDPHPLSALDGDGDGMPDDWENQYNVSDPDADPDNDHLTNVREFTFGGLPGDPDTDLDGLGDGFEADSTGTSVSNRDTDGGGIIDGLEYAMGRNPLDPADDDNLSGVDVGGLPQVTRLQQPSPNPFNAQLVIAYDLARSSRVLIEVFDMRGRLVRTLVDEPVAAGRQRVVWLGQDDAGRAQASGTYFIRLRADGEQQIKKVSLVK